MNFPLVYIVVLNWNSADDTIACVKSLESLDYPNFRVVIIDNGSQDGSETILRQKFPNYHFIQTGKNLGYAGGNNRGIKFSVENGAEYIWIVNPDVIVSNASLETMVRVMERDPVIGVCGPRSLWGTPPQVELFDGASVYPAAGYAIQHNRVSSESKEGDVKDVDYVIGCSILIRSELLKQLGLLREDFFLYFEESEFCLRAKSNGWRAVICPDVKDQHQWSWNKKSSSDFYYATRNRVLLARIRKKYFLKTVVTCLDITNSRRLNFLGWLRVVYHNFRPVVHGLLKPLKPVPKLGGRS